jgi:hypothetical protein
LIAEAKASDDLASTDLISMIVSKCIGTVCKIKDFDNPSELSMKDIEYYFQMCSKSEGYWKNYYNDPNAYYTREDFEEMIHWLLPGAKITYDGTFTRLLDGDIVAYCSMWGAAADYKIKDAEFVDDNTIKIQLFYLSGYDISAGSDVYSVCECTVVYDKGNGSNINPSFSIRSKKTIETAETDNEPELMFDENGM